MGWGFPVRIELQFAMETEAAFDFAIFDAKSRKAKGK
jgi:hypothetical protein